MFGSMVGLILTAALTCCFGFSVKRSSNRGADGVPFFGNSATVELSAVVALVKRLLELTFFGSLNFLSYITSTLIKVLSLAFVLKLFILSALTVRQFVRFLFMPVATLFMTAGV